MTSITGVVSAAHNKVLTDTFRFLSMTLAFSGLTAIAGIALGIPPMGMGFSMVFLVAYFGLLYAIEKNKNNQTGVLLVFVLTGVLGLTLSPMLGALIGAGKGGLIATALLGTGGVFFGASHIGKTTDKDLGLGARFVMPVMLMAFVGGLVNAFVFQAPMFANIISTAFLVCSSFVIAWQVQSIVRGGERNYVTATVTLYVSMYNIFTSLLHLLNAADD
jgi:modulator of FtsH protease